jgi:hypothetical protein
MDQYAANHPPCASHDHEYSRPDPSGKCPEPDPNRIRQNLRSAGQGSDPGRRYIDILS